MQTHHAMLLGSPMWDIRFAGVFGVGAVYYLFRDKIPLTDAGAAIAAILLTGLMFNRSLAETAFAIFGGYLILWFSFKFRVLRLSRFDNNVDISYGIYLYGWPIQSLIIWNDRTVNPWALCFLSLLAASLMGYVSWTLVEKPCLRLARGRRVVFASP
jgi:peptidoglycan/LPS O-acetylase OafA/YrhL